MDKIFEVKLSIFFTSKSLKIKSYLFFKSNDVSDFSKLSKLNLKKFSKKRLTAY